MLSLADVDLAVAIIFMTMVIGMVIAGGVMLHFSKR
jgi:hypothetical protein